VDLIEHLLTVNLVQMSKCYWLVVKTATYAFVLCLCQDPNKRFGASLGALSGGRVGITSMCVTNLTLAVTISIRYSAARKQFGPRDDEEIPVLEYPLQVSA
jgi:hypothetical protein